MLKTRICEQLGIEHPVVGAPMTGQAGAELCAAVSAAGGFGFLGANAGDGDWLRGQIRQVRELTDRPFGVGFISSFDSTRTLFEVAVDEKVAAISHAFADPEPWARPTRDAGICLVVQIQSVVQAERARALGADVIVAQGTEAGGHTGHSATLPLVPAVIDAVGDTPVLAAGGIADGRGLAAAIMLGAEGAWIGTRLVATPEATSKDWLKARVVAAGADDTVLTKAYDVALQMQFPDDVMDRVVKNEFTTTWGARVEELRAHRGELALRLREAKKAGDASWAAVRAGIAVGLIHEVKPAGEIVRELVAEAEAILRERPGAVLR